MLTKRTLVAWAAHLVLCGAAVAAADADFFIEGVADPAYERTRPGAAGAAEFEKRVCQQAYTDAVYHISAYARGIRFQFDFSDKAQPKHEFGRMEYQSLGTLLPKSKQYRLLNSTLAVGRITYAAKDVPRLKLREGLHGLPVYPVLGEFHNPQMEVRRTVMHWLAAKDCYRTAIMVHLARKYGNRPVLKVSGRVYPVEFTQAEMVPIPEPETPPDESGTGEQPPASAPAPSASEPAEPPAGDAPTPGDAPGAEADQPKPDAEPAPPTPKVWESTQFIYRLQMGVRVQIDLDGIQFAEEPAPQPVPETTPTEPDKTPAEPEKAPPAQGTDSQNTPAPDGS